MNIQDRQREVLKYFMQQHHYELQWMSMKLKTKKWEVACSIKNMAGTPMHETLHTTRTTASILPTWNPRGG